MLFQLLNTSLFLIAFVRIRQIVKAYKTVLSPFCHPGFAWAARRKFLIDIEGLFDKNIGGTGDMMMAKIFAKEHTVIHDWLDFRN